MADLSKSPNPAPEEAAALPVGRRGMMVGLLATCGVAALPARVLAAGRSGMRASASSAAPTVFRAIAADGTSPATIWGLDLDHQLWAIPVSESAAYSTIGGAELVAPAGNLFIATATATPADGIARVYALDMYGHAWSARLTNLAVPPTWRQAGAGLPPRPLRMLTAGCALTGAGQVLQLVAVDDSYACWTAIQPLATGKWTRWRQVGSNVPADGMVSISLTNDADGSLRVMALGSIGQLWTTVQSWSTGRWSPWSHPTAPRRPEGVRAIVALGGSQPGLLAIHQTDTLAGAFAGAGTVEPWQGLAVPPGRGVISVAAAPLSDGSTALWLLDRMGALWGSTLSGGLTGPWQNLMSAV